MSTTAQLRYTLVAGATAVVIGLGFTLVGLDRQSASDAAPAARSAQIPLAAAPPAPSSDAAAGDLFDTTTSPSPSASASATPKPKPKVTTTAPKLKPKPKPEPKASSKKPPSIPETSGSVLDRALAHINNARSAEGLSALSLDTNLSRAAALHNRLMIDGCGLSHQCSGEGGIGERFSAQGVRWSSAGENIGVGNAADNDNAVLKAANGLCDSMLAETPPNDGHRKNLLNRNFKRIGLSIVRDGDGRVWLTQDFVG